MVLAVRGLLVPLEINGGGAERNVRPADRLHNAQTHFNFARVLARGSRGGAVCSDVSSSATPFGFFPHLEMVSLCLVY